MHGPDTQATGAPPPPQSTTETTRTPAASSPPGGENETPKSLSWWKDHPRRTADCTLALAAGTIALAAFALFQMRAADTALHVTERAYITVGSPTLDPTTKFINFLLSNNGHIPSGNIEIIVHEATMNTSRPNVAPNINEAVEYHWKRHKLTGLPPGPNFFGMKVPIREFSEDKFKPEGAYQAVLVAGRVRYDDGFANDGSQTWPFCFQSQYQTILKQIFLVPCDPDPVIPLMEKRDGYPNNEASD